MADKGEQRYYVMSRVNWVFAISSLIMLATFIWMFVYDYDREWKHYQREFRSLEIAKTRAALDTEEARLEGEQNYRDAVDNVLKVEADIEIHARDIKGVKKTIAEMQAASDKANKDYQFEKSRYDAAKYRYEHSVGTGHESAGYKSDMDAHFTEMERLRLINEAAATDLDSAQAGLSRMMAAMKAMQDSVVVLSKARDLLERKLQTIDPASMSFFTRLGSYIRDMPLLDFLNPSYKIEQVVLRDVQDDLNFMKVPKVDRCQSCHLGLLKENFASDAQPYRTHPRLDLYLKSSSPHPVEEFGCSSCHLGRGRGTSFLMTVHRPGSSAEEEEWKNKYGWYQYEYWETPMLPLKYTEASCLNCHAGATELRGADRLNLGLQVIEKAGCYGCHNIARYEGRSKPGPSLRKIATKLTKDWAYRWILNPKSFRHNTWMPRFFDQSNNSSGEMKARTRQEIHAIVAYLFGHSDTQALAPNMPAGDAMRGEKVVAQAGCFGCHMQEDVTGFSEARGSFIRTNTTSDMIRRMQGPELTGLATKTTALWVYNWVRDPKAYAPHTRMPNLRLSDQEAADVAAYLMRDKNEKFNEVAIPPVDEKVLDRITVEFLAKNLTEAQAKAQVAAMKLDQKLDFAGRKLVGNYGCFGCHEINGFDTAMPIGTDLTEEGSKPVSKLDFGFMHEIGHNNYDWFAQKLKDPRIFDRAKELTPLDKLRMPNFDLSDTEVDAVVTALVGLVKPSATAAKIYPRTPRNLYVEDGQRLVREFNCQGCHVIEGRGGSIRPKMWEGVVKYEGMDSVIASLDENTLKQAAVNVSPPNLAGAGAKIRSEWLAKFIRDPSAIHPRPWLKVRMPTFGFSDTQVNTLVKYLAYLDNAPFPFSEPGRAEANSPEVATGKTLFADNQCVNCHVLGGVDPKKTEFQMAPDLTLVGDKMRTDGMIRWIRNPAGLNAEVRMPAYFNTALNAPGDPNVFGGDELRQAAALRDYLFTLRK